MTKRLGRGLADLIEPAPQPPPSSASGSANFVMLRIDQVMPGRFQPRTSIPAAELEELKASIQRSGVIEPILVRPTGSGTYEVVAGERRLRASQSLGLQEIPALIKTLSDQQALECSIIENVQRQNLNPIEEAGGYARLLNEFGYTQEAVADSVGKDRATIANLLRLLTLPEEIRRGLSDGTLAVGHAKVLLAIEDRAKQIELYRQVVGGGLSVRQTEGLVAAAAPTRRRRMRRSDPQWQSVEDALRQALGTKVSLFSRKNGGRILIDYFSQEDLSRILNVLGVTVAG